MECPYCGSHNISYEHDKLICWCCEMQINFDNMGKNQLIDIQKEEEE